MVRILKSQFYCDWLQSCINLLSSTSTAPLPCFSTMLFVNTYLRQNIFSRFPDCRTTTIRSVFSEDSTLVHWWLTFLIYRSQTSGSSLPYLSCARTAATGPETPTPGSSEKSGKSFDKSFLRDRLSSASNRRERFERLWNSRPRQSFLGRFPRSGYGSKCDRPESDTNVRSAINCSSANPDQ